MGSMAILWDDRSGVFATYGWRTAANGIRRPPIPADVSAQQRRAPPFNPDVRKGLRQAALFPLCLVHYPRRAQTVTDTPPHQECTIWTKRPKGSPTV